MGSLAQAFSVSDAQGISVDRKKGKIVLKSEILFESGKSDLTDRGRLELKRVASALNQVIFQPQFAPLIEGIMIEGHTNSKGEVNRNWELSSERALNSLRHLFTLPEVKKHPQRYKSLLFAGAFGESRPVRRKGKEQAHLSRRIEIRILFNHSQTKSLTNDLKRFSPLP
jgi:chemotaxis protein MotB